MKERGFTLVEMVIAMLIISIIMALSGNTFKRFLFGVRSESESAESNIDKLVGLEIMRLDLEHVGYGIAGDVTDAPIAWAESGTSPTQIRTLTLRSTLNNTNQSTLGWYLYNCTIGLPLAGQLVSSQGGTSPANTIVLLDIDNDWAANTTRSAGNCPATDIYTGYPYTGTGCTASAQNCTEVVYDLSTTQNLANCATGTKNLLRTVDAGTGDPILNCVADFTVRFDLDTNADGIIDSSTSILPGAAAIMSQVKNIDVYVLMQIGQKERDYTFSGSETLDGVAFDRTGITDFNQYRWKVLKLSGRPMVWQ